MILDGKTALKLVTEFVASYESGDMALINRFMTGESDLVGLRNVARLNQFDNNLCRTITQTFDMYAIPSIINESIQEHLDVIYRKLTSEGEKQEEVWSKVLARS